MGDTGHPWEIWYNDDRDDDGEGEDDEDEGDEDDLGWYHHGTANPYEAQYYASFVVQETRKRERVWHPHDAEHGACETVEWHDKEYPTCNVFHEFDFASSYKRERSHLIG